MAPGPVVGGVDVQPVRKVRMPIGSLRFAIAPSYSAAPLC